MPFQILSLSGGGFRGLYTAAVLAVLEERIGAPIAQRFDLIAGTSIGGIIALGLAAQKSAAEIRDAFKEHGTAIFSNRPAPQSWAGKKLALLENARTAKYSADPLQSVIEKIVGAETKVGDLQHRVIVPSVNLTKGRPQVFKTAHHRTFVRDWRLRAVDVALATSAAPTFFPLHKIGGELFADGGLYANAPDHIALHEAEHFLEQAPDSISMLSIGTTTASFSISNTIDINMGWGAWMDDQRLPSVMIAAQQLNTEAMLQHRLKDRYLRIDHEQSSEQQKYLGLDIATKAVADDLLGLAEGSVRYHLGRAILPSMLDHRPTPPTFFNL